MAVRPTAPQRATALLRPLPAQHSPALQHTTNSSPSRQVAAASSNARTVGSITDIGHNTADTVAPASSCGKGEAGSGMPFSSSANNCGSTGEGVEAGGGSAASSCGRNSGMRGGFGGRQEGTERVGGSEVMPVSSLTSAGQVHDCVT